MADVIDTLVFPPLPSAKLLCTNKSMTLTGTPCLAYRRWFLQVVSALVWSNLAEEGGILGFLLSHFW